MRPLGLYLHIPFCKAKCIYCDFYSLPHSEEKMDAYTAALQRDLIRWADQAKGHTVDTIYFGGGTPSYLGAERLCRILETVFAHYRVDKNAEITTEANPDSARRYQHCGSSEKRASTAFHSGCSRRATTSCA